MAQRGEQARRHDTGSDRMDVHDILIIVDPAMAHHLLRLLVDDLARSADASPEWRQEVSAIAHYIHDALSPSLRISLPPDVARAAE